MSVPELSCCRMAVIGASAGGVEALQQLFQLLDPGLRIPLVTVLHLHDDSQGMTGLFQPATQLRVVEAESGMRPEAGTVVLAPAGYHLFFETDGRLGLALFERINYTRPAIDPLFDTAASVFGAGLCTVILTGAGEDGSRGLARAVAAGAAAMVQHPEEATVASMPAAALRAAPGVPAATLAQIAGALNRAGGGRSGPVSA